MRFHRHSHCAPPNEGGGWSGRRMHGRFGRQGPRGRTFEQGDLRYVVLKLLSEKPSHGYEIIKAVEDRLGGSYAPSPGVVYPTLTFLEELGYTAVQSAEGPRKLYAITEEGRKALDENKAVVDGIFERMAEVNARFGGGPAPQIIRAMENLRMALRLRMGRGSLSATQTAQITTILDDAARAVESA